MNDERGRAMAKKPESNDPLKKKSSKCYFKVEYEDLLGNKYESQATFMPSCFEQTMTRHSIPSLFHIHFSKRKIY